MVRIAALSVNGSGPFTDWKSVETYYNDLYGNCEIFNICVIKICKNFLK